MIANAIYATEKSIGLNTIIFLKLIECSRKKKSWIKHISMKKYFRAYFLVKRKFKKIISFGILLVTTPNQTK